MAILLIVMKIIYIYMLTCSSCACFVLKYTRSLPKHHKTNKQKKKKKGADIMKMDS